jgi:hypothetical protein
MRDRLWSGISQYHVTIVWIKTVRQTGATQMTPVKTLIKPTWTIEKLQEVTSHALINNIIAVNKLLEKLPPETRNEWRTLVIGMKVEYFKTLNVTTPIDLAIAMGEFDTNVWGSKVTVTGDEHKAIIEIENCGCFNLMQKHMCLTPEIIEQRLECYKTTIELITRELGLIGKVEIINKVMTIHITK